MSDAGLAAPSLHRNRHPITARPSVLWESAGAGYLSLRWPCVQATKNCLDAAVAAGSSHYVLLSAICVQKPLLEFQKAKLKFEADLQATETLTHSIVRPTAFFKSLAGQVESVKKGGPYVMFGDGHLAACKPISEEDLAAFMGDCVLQEDKINQAQPRAIDPCAELCYCGQP